MESKIDILSVPIWNLTLEEAKDLVFQWIEEGKAASIATANAEMLMRAKEDEELANILRHADLVVPDGAGVLWAAEQQGKKFKERVAGLDLSCRLLQEAAVRGTKVYFFGGAEGIAAAAAQKVAAMYGPISVAGVHSGFFSPENETDIIREICDTGAQILLVALGVPKQEKWIAQHLYELGPCVCIGVGGSLDVLAGKALRAPKWMQEHRLEWFFRLYKEPTRFKRMLALPRFVAAVKAQRRS
ncbi:WecB/TagA/CpsF family glycosyltransferase [Megasphaera vaginalis (ex Srinivasan et al. 2021)]|uniref:N-acetylglucosaminyldiphosphoundecaprenol N-acetyl-beta-D-mannosaminyltransferase n=1 Tax=Megasphaera vaginalis (ex Srinivasan et al. 2021) TaxID=1111454 RepID=U7UC63_9FIRM|nr:WecB/TagA/CpsF family glycosyltransferase [Megasphaera vaginalis (ex Srinivasan et al. 2021)]ERT56444.1 glycosyltransferase WecB/TagA/CpsF family protein [Megasphaera vaginalis (ex Srinivasan et al. 2021)]